MGSYRSAATRDKVRRALPPATLLVLIFAFIYACVPRPIADLRAVGVSRVPASMMPPGEDMRDTLMRRGEFVWKLSFSGDAGWIDEVRRHELNSYAVVVRCDNRDASLFALGPYVGQVRVTYYDQGFRAYRPSSAAERYDIYLPETGAYLSVTNANARGPEYDFRVQRMTLCIRIAGGAMHGAYGRSNEVSVGVGPDG